MKSLEKICSYCGTRINRSPKVWKDTPGQADVFCSPNCIKDLLFDNIEARIDKPIRQKSKTPMVSNYYSSYSNILNKSFRSWFEVLVAEYFYKHCIGFWYEKVTIELFDRKRHWTPDFYIPVARTFVEVKGVWALGGKRKYVEAVRITEEPIILIPYWMKEKFRRE